MLPFPPAQLCGARAAPHSQPQAALFYCFSFPVCQWRSVFEQGICFVDNIQGAGSSFLTRANLLPCLLASPSASPASSHASMVSLTQKANVLLDGPPRGIKKGCLLSYATPAVLHMSTIHRQCSRGEKIPPCSTSWEISVHGGL